MTLDDFTIGHTFLTYSRGVFDCQNFYHVGKNAPEVTISSCFRCCHCL